MPLADAARGRKRREDVSHSKSFAKWKSVIDNFACSAFGVRSRFVGTAFRKQSLPGNHVVGIREDVIAGAPRCFGPQYSIATERPSDDADCQWLWPSTVIIPIGIRGDLVIVIAVDFHVIRCSPGIDEVADRDRKAINRRGLRGDSGTRVGRILYSGRRNKNDDPGVSRIV
jgi:hypothetical protein